MEVDTARIVALLRGPVRRGIRRGEQQGAKLPL
jgi:hypothetical protein